MHNPDPKKNRQQSTGNCKQRTGRKAGEKFWGQVGGGNRKSGSESWQSQGVFEPLFPT